MAVLGGVNINGRAGTIPGVFIPAIATPLLIQRLTGRRGRA
jgi:hypothetical protein